MLQKNKLIKKQETSLRLGLTCKQRSQHRVQDRESVCMDNYTSYCNTVAEHTTPEGLRTEVALWLKMGSRQTSQMSQLSSISSIFPSSASDPSPMQETMWGMQSPSRRSSYYQSSDRCSKVSISHQKGDMLISVIRLITCSNQSSSCCTTLLFLLQVIVVDSSSSTQSQIVKIILFFPLQ